MYEITESVVLQIEFDKYFVPNAEFSIKKCQTIAGKKNIKCFTICVNIVVHNLGLLFAHNCGQN